MIRWDPQPRSPACLVPLLLDFWLCVVEKSLKPSLLAKAPKQWAFDSPSRVLHTYAVSCALNRHPCGTSTRPFWEMVWNLYGAIKRICLDCFTGCNQLLSASAQEGMKEMSKKFAEVGSEVLGWGEPGLFSDFASTCELIKKMPEGLSFTKRYWLLWVEACCVGATAMPIRGLHACGEPHVRLYEALWMTAGRQSYDNALEPFIRPSTRGESPCTEATFVEFVALKFLKSSVAPTRCRTAPGPNWGAPLFDPSGVS